MCIFFLFDTQQVKATYEKFWKKILDRIKQSCTFADAKRWNPIASGFGDTLHRHNKETPCKGSLHLRAFYKVCKAKPIFEKSAFVVIGEIECTLFQCIAFEVQKPFFLNKADRNGKG